MYQELGKELKYLWSSDLRTNTVHVEDVARACWTAAVWRSKQPVSAAGEAPSPTTLTTPSAAPKGPSADVPVFNIVDSGVTNQGTMAAILKALFGIETGFQNTLINTFARLNLEHIVDDVNDETLDPWAELLQRSGKDSASSGPLSPFMEKELLRDLDLSLDGGKFVKTTGFE